MLTQEAVPLPVNAMFSMTRFDPETVIGPDGVSPPLVVVVVAWVVVVATVVVVVVGAPQTSTANRGTSTQTRSSCAVSGTTSMNPAPITAPPRNGATRLTTLWHQPSGPCL
ncbi:MAG: hypothetical protein L0Z47_11025 [Actinobacteria bacterium]|nr:hypothetical protein [Actinomycetota bacterium]